MTTEADSQATEQAGALTSEQLQEVLAPETKQSEAEADGAEPEAGAETEQTEGTEPEGEQEKPEGEGSEDRENEEGDKSKKRLSGSQRLKRERDALKAEVEALRSRAGDGEVSQAAVEKLIGKAPKEDDFKGDFLAYERALTVYEMRKANAEDRIREQSESAKSARQDAMREAAESHKERIDEFRSKVKDFDETMRGADKLKTAQHVEELILDSDKSAHLVYHLAKNPDRLARLNQMSERDAAREIGRIESRLSLPQPKKQTTAPKPVSTLKGGAAPTSHDADLDAYLKKTYG